MKFGFEEFHLWFQLALSLMAAGKVSVLVLLHCLTSQIKFRIPYKFSIWTRIWIEFLILRYANDMQFRFIPMTLKLFVILNSEWWLISMYTLTRISSLFPFYTLLCLCVVGSSGEGAEGVYQTEARWSHHSTAGRQAVHWKPALGNERRIMGNMCRLNQRIDTDLFTTL